jgi:hypothetical protein
MYSRRLAFNASSVHMPCVCNWGYKLSDRRVSQKTTFDTRIVAIRTNPSSQLDLPIAILLRVPPTELLHQGNGRSATRGPRIVQRFLRWAIADKQKAAHQFSSARLTAFGGLSQ